MNAGDRAEVKKREKRIKRKDRVARDDLLWILSDRRGRRFLWDLFGSCGVFASAMGPDPYWTAHNEGRRVIGVTLWKTITETDPNALVLMAHEDNQERENIDDDGPEQRDSDDAAFA